jgi:hypothetical protein
MDTVKISKGQGKRYVRVLIITVRILADFQQTWELYIGLQILGPTLPGH